MTETVVLSDLHLGSQSNVLGTPAVRERLFEQLAGADQVVLLGDTLSLRAAPLDAVLTAARPFLSGLDDALGGARIVLVGGNHDHRLAEALIDGAPGGVPGGPLGLARVAEPAGDVATAVARELPRCEVVVAYPGIFIRPDVYATHGHYLDCHMTVPRLESLLAAGMQAVSGRLPDGHLHVEDYEGVLAPLYAFAYRRAQSPASGSPSTPLAGIARRASAQGWRGLAGGDALRQAPARVLRATAAAAAVAAINRAGLGAFRADLSLPEIGRAGLRAVEQVIGRLGVDADHVIFGHTHRAGPLAGENWSSGRARLVNPGSWIWEPTLIGDSGARSPYWPGRYVVVPRAGAPELRSALEAIGAREPALP